MHDDVDVFGRVDRSEVELLGGEVTLAPASFDSARDDTRRSRITARSTVVSSAVDTKMRRSHRSISSGRRPLVFAALRREMPDRDRPFRLPGGDVIPFLAFFSSNMIV